MHRRSAKVTTTENSKLNPFYRLTTADQQPSSQVPGPSFTKLWSYTHCTSVRFEESVCTVQGKGMQLNAQFNIAHITGSPSRITCKGTALRPVLCSSVGDVSRRHFLWHQ